MARRYDELIGQGLAPRPFIGPVDIQRLEPLDTLGFSPVSTEPSSVAIPGANFPGLGTAAGKLHEATQIPHRGAIPEDLSDLELKEVQGRWEKIFTSVPGVNPTTARNLALDPSLSVDEAITHARAATKAQEEKSWWSTAWDWTGGGLLDGMEWLYVNTVGDVFQEFGELAGIDPEYAQHMSAGQNLLLIMETIREAPLSGWDRSVESTNDVLTRMERQPNADGTYSYRFNKEQDRLLSWASGALDIVARLTLDPTLVAGKFRAVRALPFGAEKLFRVTRQVAGATAPRVQRLRNLALAEGQEAARLRAARLIDPGSGGRAFMDFLVGDLKMSEYVRTLVGNPPVRKFTRDMVDFARNYDSVSVATAKALPRYGKLGFGRTAEPDHFAYIVQRVKSLADELDEPLENIPLSLQHRRAEEALVDQLLGSPRREVVEALEGMADEISDVFLMRNQAAKNFEDATARIKGIQGESAEPIKINFFGEILDDPDIPVTLRNELEKIIDDHLRVSVRNAKNKPPKPDAPAKTRVAQPLPDEAERTTSNLDLLDELRNDVDLSVDHTPFIEEWYPADELNRFIGKPDVKSGRTLAKSAAKRVLEQGDAQTYSRALTRQLNAMGVGEEVHVFVVADLGRVNNAPSVIAALTPEAAMELLPASQLPKVFRVPRRNIYGLFGHQGDLIVTALPDAVPIDISELKSVKGFMDDSLQVALRESLEEAPEAAARQTTPTTVAAPAEEVVTSAPQRLEPINPREIEFTMLTRRGQKRAESLLRGEQQRVQKLRVGQEIHSAEWLSDNINTLDEFLETKVDELRPWLKHAGVDDYTAEDIALKMDELKGQLGYLDPLQEFPYQSITGQALNWLGDTPLKAMPVLRSLNVGYLPHRALDVDDPYWWRQVERLGRYFDAPEEEITAVLARLIESGGPRGARETVETFVEDGLIRMGFNPAQIQEIRDATNRYMARSKGVIGDKSMVDDWLATTYDNIIPLVDPRVVKRMQRMATQSELRASLTNQTTELLDKVNSTFKRLMVSMPKTGLRVLLETQLRALAMGLDNIYTNPVKGIGIMGLAVISPKRGLALAQRFARKEVRDIAIRLGDVGMAQQGYLWGDITRREWTIAQRAQWKNMDNPIVRNAYRQDQAEWMNEVLLSDESIRRWIIWRNDPNLGIEGANERLRRFLMSADPQAHAYRQTVGRLRGLDVVSKKGREAIDKHLQDIYEATRVYGLHNEDLAFRALRRQVTADDIRELGLEAPTIMRGPRILGTTATETARNFLDAAVERNLARIEFIGRDFTSRAELYRDTMERVRLLEGQGKSVNLDWVMTELRGGATPAEAVLERTIVNASRKQTFDRMRQLFFDMSNHSRLAEALRFIFPFGNAYQEVLGVWGRIFLERPWVPHMGKVFWDAASSGVPGLTYIDPQSGEKMYRIPLVQHIMRLAGLKTPNFLNGLPDNLAFGLTGRLDSFNMVTTGLPIPGPFLQFPAKKLLQEKPNATEVMEVLFPFGAKTFLESLEPGWFNEAQALVETYLGTEQNNIDFGNIAGTLILEDLTALLQQAEAAEDPEQAAEIRATIEALDGDSVIGRARWILAIRLASRLFSPSPITERSPMRDMIDFYRHAQTADPELADAMFVARYGEEILAMFQERTKIITKGTPPPTKAAAKLFVGDPAFREFVEDFGQVGWDIVRPIVNDEFDPTFFRTQEEDGHRKRYPLPDLKRQAVNSVAWQMFFDARHAIEEEMMAAGYNNLSVKGAEPFKAALDSLERKMAQAYPTWQQDRKITLGHAQENVGLLSIVPNVPQLSGVDSVEGIREYFELRAKANEALQREGLKDINAQGAIHLKSAFRKGVRAIVDRHPHFAPIWGRYLLRDNPGQSLISRIDLEGRYRPGIIEEAALVNERGEIRSEVGLMVD